ERGFDIATASINPVDRPLEKMTEQEKAEATNTFFVKPQGMQGALRAAWQTLMVSPVAFFRGLLLALKMGRADIPRTLYCLFYFAEALLVGQWMKQKGLTHLHAHFGNQGSTVAMLVAQTFPIQYSLTIHGPDEFFDVQGQYLKEKVQAAKFVCCIGYYAQSQLERLVDYSLWNKFFVSPLGVDPSRFLPRTEPDSDHFEILCVGRLVAAKGQHVLVSAVEQLAREGRAVHLRLIGAGPDTESLNTRIKNQHLEECVTLEGVVNQDQIRNFYAQAHVFALASFAEGIPVVLMEAMAMEIPCVTTNITGIPELIESGETGFLVIPSDVDGLANAIRKLMDDKVLRLRVGKAGREKVLRAYDLNKNIDKLAGIFKANISY
ncbi:MAG TPA: glycosyltransferase family 4 protein, partial [Pseudomonadales bacterium]|nr:glycosyltransferase family 4 protein [Pseudomonadales bacterium]